ncbi:MAG: DMT family transporter [Desulfovibrionaceae bacterium]|nr:DMT family transporter [Desulfovibrionaceae bacterium]
MSRIPEIIYVKQVLTAIFWGGMYVAGRVVAASVPPMSAAFIRFLLAGAILFAVWNFSSGRQMPRGRQWAPLLLLGMTGAFLYNFFFFNGLQTVSAGRAAVIITTNPLITAILARIIFREPMPPLKALGILIAAGGAMYVVTRGDLGSIFHDALSEGDLFLVCAALTWTAYSLLNKLAADLSALTAITFTCIFGCIMLLPFAAWEGVFVSFTDYSWQVWLCLVYIVICCTVLSFVWFNQGVCYLGAQRASLFINLIPGVTVVLGACILNEPITADIVTGVVLVCAGVFMANRCV